MEAHDDTTVGHPTTVRTPAGAAQEAAWRRLWQILLNPSPETPEPAEYPAGGIVSQRDEAVRARRGEGEGRS